MIFLLAFLGGFVLSTDCRTGYKTAFCELHAACRVTMNGAQIPLLIALLEVSVYESQVGYAGRYTWTGEWGGWLRRGLA